MNVLTILVSVYLPVLAVWLASEQLGAWLDRNIPRREPSGTHSLGASAAPRPDQAPFLRGVDTEGCILS